MSATWTAPTITDEQVRAARRAYYGAISYVDDQCRPPAQRCGDPGSTRDTIIIFTADHGDMLGERGLWYKMSFFEGCLPRAADRARPGEFRRAARERRRSRWSTCCRRSSTSPATAPRADWPTPIDGRSLLPHLAGSGGHDEVIGEYSAEGAIAPIVMIRRGATSSSTAGGSRSALRPRRRSAGADQSRDGPGPGSAAGGVQGRGGPALGSAGARSGRAREPAAAAPRRRHADHRHRRRPGTTSRGATPAATMSATTWTLDDIEAKARFPRVRRAAAS